MNTNRKMMKKKSVHILWLLITGLALTMASCGKDNEDPETPPEVVNEEELITTVTLQFHDPTGVNPDVVATFRDVDGPGGADPTQFDTIFLAPSTLYEATILLLNESVDPAENITDEVSEEAVDHLFCYTSNGADLSIIRTDSDGTFALGINSTWQAGVAGEGSVNVVLKHQPGIKDGTCDPGETDVEVEFPVLIQ